jgi:hypothetical protein
MQIDPTRLYPPLRPGAHVRLEADPARGHDRRYLRALAETVDFGGVTIATRRPLPVGSLVRLHLLCPSEAGDEPPFRARALVRARRAWVGRRIMALQFLEFEGLGSRSLASCLDTVLSPSGLPPGKPATGASLGRRWIAALLDRPRAADLSGRRRSPAPLRVVGAGEPSTLRSLS